jgi:type IV pilus assembly protein PilQ
MKKNLIILLSGIFFLNISAQTEKELPSFLKEEFQAKPENVFSDTLPEALEEFDIENLRHINISVVFFEANVFEMQERGINWQAILSKHGLLIGTDFKSFSKEEAELPPNFNLSVEAEGDIGKFSGYTTALLNFFESENLGEVIAKLSITVRDKQKGRIQVGSDFSVKQRDFAGNVMDEFFPTGTIINVIPNIFEKDSLQFALLKLNIEKSFPIPGDISIQVNKTSAETEIILLDNEEAIVGGLLNFEEINTRGGIPFLKDLPWWVLGIRYLTGFDQKEISKREIVLVIKAEIIPTLAERLVKRKENIIREKLQEDLQDINKYKTDQQEE